MLKKIKSAVIYITARILMIAITVYRKIKPINPGIYFCYNQSIHQIYHSLFIAIELSNIQDKYDVVVLSTSKEASRIIEKEFKSIPNKIIFKKIEHSGYEKVGFSINWFVLLCRMRMYMPKAVIVTDYFDNVFRQLLVKTVWIRVPHGIVGPEYGSNACIKNYDLVVLPGKRDETELKERIGPLDNCVALGYSKFDYFKYHKSAKLELFDKDKPVIMYNPHFKKELSSFYDKGQQLLEALSKTDKYNVIFMPHPDLCRKEPKAVAKAAKVKDVVFINRPKINLEYMAISDIYITDVSSSAFEWLYFDKPALFFNTKKIDWEENRYYSSWNFGRVVENIPEIIDAVEESLNRTDQFQEAREKLFSSIFLNSDQKVSRMIAAKIMDIIEKKK